MSDRGVFVDLIPVLTGGIKSFYYATKIANILQCHALGMGIKQISTSFKLSRNTLTVEPMNHMKLRGMTTASTESLTSTMAETMTIDSFLHMLLAREWDYRTDAAIQRLIRGASFR
nr:hypothetical protein [Gabonibacter massiliensis]